MKAVVFDIKRYAINDGPGIRTTLFMKGCPLRCVWCHNPESWLPEPEMLFKANKCIGCNSCGVHPHQKEFIKSHTLTPAAGECPTLALEQCGRAWTVDELLAEVEKERDVMQDSGGGVTISGGEPLLQVKGEGVEGEECGALMPLLRELGSRGFHRAVDTTLYASPDVVRTVAAETDLMLVDLKVMDGEKHKRYTGVRNDCILVNIRLLASLGTPFQIRIPLIEGINADEENIEATAAFLKSLANDSRGNRLPTIALLPYHDAGKDKHVRRGTTYNPTGIPMSTPSDATMQRCIAQFAAHGLNVKL